MDASGKLSHYGHDLIISRSAEDAAPYLPLLGVSSIQRTIANLVQPLSSGRKDMNEWPSVIIAGVALWTVRRVCHEMKYVAPLGEAARDAAL
jgi:hypothetical protein